MEAEGASAREDRQVLAISDRAGPLLITGSAGTGRSEALVRRFAALVEEGVRAERILVLARTRAGSAALRDRVENALPEPHEEPWIGTYEEIAERILREHPVAAGLDPFFTTVAAADRLAILLDCV